jgi:hypothetical protein
VSKHLPGVIQLGSSDMILYRLALDLLGRVLETHIVGLIAQDEDTRVYVIAPGEEPLPLIDALERFDWARARHLAEEFSA